LQLSYQWIKQLTILKKAPSTIQQLLCGVMEFTTLDNLFPILPTNLTTLELFNFSYSYEKNRLTLSVEQFTLLPTKLKSLKLSGIWVRNSNDNTKHVMFPSMLQELRLVLPPSTESSMFLVFHLK
jgi:hypothetical protein